ncbi:hypothetical protein IEQ34_001777 [Dendrobium chrysotoxum]|uniref:Uncharacterized protein n=1 Tax=Dendrobium chrysotoxum TaxID=161865 RepID=A0AAV7H8V8_DENCH|nr:hypothetical protein IEQ34_001777 [Dendrobium chrysotoxum]
MEDLAEECFNELLNRNLLLPKEEAPFGALNMRNSIISIKLRGLSVANQEAAIEIFDYVADQEA